MDVVAEPYVKCQEQEVEPVAEAEEEEIAEPLLLSTSADSDTGESGVSDVSRNGELKVPNGIEEINGEEEDSEHGEVAEVEKVEEVGIGEELTGKNVYFDKASAFSKGTSGVRFRSTEVSISEDGSMIQSSKLTEESVNIQESRTIIRTQHKAIKDAEIEPVYHSSESVQANGSHHPTLDSTINGNGHVSIRNHNEQEYHIKRDYSEELGVIYEGDPEPIDYDVEQVLKKQETHDLICPNCYSCITRRVILKKRKRVLKNTHINAKRDGIEETGGSEISHPDIVQEALDESLTNRAENIINGQQEVITCWSCFSLLIPTGKEFRLFWRFGGRKQIEPEVMSESNSIQTPLVTSGGGGISLDQGNTVNPVQLANGYMVEQKSNMNSVTAKKGSDFKLFWSYGNNRDDNFKSSQQTSTTQTDQFSTSSEKTTNSQGAVNQVEKVNTTVLPTNEVINSKQTNFLAFAKNGFHSVGTDYLTTHTQLDGKDIKIEAGPNLKPQKNVASTIMYSPEELKIKTDNKPNTEFDSFEDRKLFKSEDIVSAVQGSTLLDKLVTDSGNGLNVTADDLRILIDNDVKQGVLSRPEEVSRDIVIPGTETGTRVYGREQAGQLGLAHEWDILKSIVYGGLIESITSLGVVASAAGAETATVNILVLGLANLIVGLILIFHYLKDLRKSANEGRSNQVDRYYQVLGRRNNFKLHAVVVVLSFLIFGLIPIITYGFTFRKSDNRDYKSLAVIGVSTISVTLLSLGKAHTKNPPRAASSYIKSLTYYISIAISASGLSYVAGKLLQELIEKTGWFNTTSSLNSISFLRHCNAITASLGLLLTSSRDQRLRMLNKQLASVSVNSVFSSG